MLANAASITSWRNASGRLDESHPFGQNQGVHDLETIEHQAFEAWFRAAMAVDTGNFRWTRFRQGDALCYGSATEPSILINRVLN